MYNVRVKVSRMNTAGVFCYACDKDGTRLGKYPNLFTEYEAEAFSPIIPENCTKNTETAPKYDPCRPFKAGDIVTPITVNKRWLSDLWEGREGMCFKVVEDEDSHEAYMEVEDPDSDLPYTVNVAYFIVDKKHESGEQNVVMYMFAFHPHAKEAAEAECARLNAEHRKEQR